MCGNSFADPTAPASKLDKSVNKNSTKTKDKLKLKTLKLQGNKELPKALYIVPWQQVEIEQGSRYRQQLVLHSLYGDLFDPVSADQYTD